MGSSHDEEAFAAGLSRLHRTRVVLAHRHRTSASYRDLCAGASATRHALPGGSPRAVKALGLAAHSAATSRRADASRRSRVGRQRFLMESRQILAFALRFIDDWRAGAADRVRECRHPAAGARGGAAEGNCRPDIDRCGALALLLVTTAALFIRTLDKLRSVDTGFDRDHVLLFSLDLGPSYDKLAVRWGLYHRILAELQRLPGTVAASFSMIPYLSHSSWTDNLVPDGYVRGKDEDVECYGVTVGPDFARAAGLKLLAGRDFGLEDQPQHPPAEPKPGVGPQLPPVVIVSESLARYYFGQQDPLGRYLHFDSPDAEAPQGRMRIIGVVNDTSYRSLRDPKPRAFYIPFFQTAGGFGDDPTFFVRTYGSPDAISATVQKLVSRIDARIQATETHTMRHMIDRDTLQERVLATLSAILSGFALLLVSLGVSGVSACSVTRRTGAIGIRMARRAQSGKLLRRALDEVAALLATL